MAFMSIQTLSYTHGSPWHFRVGEVWRGWHVFDAQRERECSQPPFKEQRILLHSMCLTSDRFRDFEVQISDFGAYGQWLSLFVSDFR